MNSSKISMETLLDKKQLAYGENGFGLLPLDQLSSSLMSLSAH
jgi:hypothetical protein